jgi:hypothetical protein
MNWFTPLCGVPQFNRWHLLFRVFYTISNGFGRLPALSQRPVKAKRPTRSQQNNWQL